ncbi:hypothetical protein XA68_16904 [Ophiocordyceps unilateralis]|uniref:Large ribosomal subunit protein mL53 n=1 Tax=Ophiocordyceps unilateralis TaxID=268505 RepID=A0A2A9P5E2_OPHUN|nr:hypothetical protein XA68_16904 [Ophiocordyceps unilateralis]
MYLRGREQSFNPFSTCSKSARLFLTYLPPTIRTQGTAITTQLIQRNSTEPSSITVKFKDGKQLKFSCDKFNIKGIIEEVDRLSRQLQKAEDISG